MWVLPVLGFGMLVAVADHILVQHNYYPTISTFGYFPHQRDRVGYQAIGDDGPYRSEENMAEMLKKLNKNTSKLERMMAKAGTTAADNDFRAR